MKTRYTDGNNKRITSSKLDDVRKGIAHKYLNKGNTDELSVIEEGNHFSNCAKVLL